MLYFYHFFYKYKHLLEDWAVLKMAIGYVIMDRSSLRLDYNYYSALLMDTRSAALPSTTTEKGQSVFVCFLFFCFVFLFFCFVFCFVCFFPSYLCPLPPYF